MTKIYVPIVDKLSIPLKHRKLVETECEILIFYLKN